VTGWTPPLIPRSADQQERGVRLTPPALFRELERRYLRGACNLDAAASAENALAECWFDLEHSAIAHRWRPAGARSRLLGRVEYALPVDQVDDSQLELGVDAAPGRKRPTGGAFEHSVVWVLERQLVAGDYR
jgi:hypothetical protein